MPPSWGLPEIIEVLRREDGGRVGCLILGRKPRRPVRLWFVKGSGESWGSPAMSWCNSTERQSHQPRSSSGLHLCSGLLAFSIC
jgi:hypothetical protein